MGNLRPVLIIGLVFLGYMIWVQWQKDYGPAPKPAATQTQSPSDTASVPSMAEERVADAVDLPTPSDLGTSRPEGKISENLEEVRDKRQLVSVKTDVLEVQIDPVGGTLVSAILLDYPIKQKEPENLVNLLAASGDRMFIAQSGLLSRQQAPNHTST